MRSGERLRALRYLLGLTQMDMCRFLEFTRHRLNNVEHSIAKMNEDDFRKIITVMPEAFRYILLGEPMKQSELLNSDTIMCTIPSRVKAGLAPPEFPAEMLLDDTTQSQEQNQ